MIETKCTNRLKFHKISPIDLDVIHEPCNIAIVQAMCCNHAIVRGIPKFINSDSFQNYILNSVGYIYMPILFQNGMNNAIYAV